MRQQSEQHPTDHLHANIKNINKPKSVLFGYIFIETTFIYSSPGPGHSRISSLVIYKISRHHISYSECYLSHFILYTLLTVIADMKYQPSAISSFPPILLQPSDRQIIRG